MHTYVGIKSIQAVWVSTRPETAAAWKTRHHIFIFICICTFFFFQGPVLSINSYLELTVYYIGHMISIIPESILLSNACRTVCSGWNPALRERKFLTEEVTNVWDQLCITPVIPQSTETRSRKSQEKKYETHYLPKNTEQFLNHFYKTDDMMYCTFCQNYVSWKRVDMCKCGLNPIW